MLRRLASPRPVWSREADVVVVGAGAAGMSAALAAARLGRRVVLIGKSGLGGGCTELAQGGMAAVLDGGDSAELHARDTIAAGAGLCDPEAVSVLVSEAPEALGWLSSLGARLARGHLEGGHSRPRIVHAGGDAAGAEVHRVLTAALLARGDDPPRPPREGMASSVVVMSRAVALDLVDGGLLVGLGEGELRVGLLRARAVVLATGGFGQAYATTTNPPGITGDGLALAARAGAVLTDVEFVQFHPTVLWSPGASGQQPLITEALRGAGAVLVDSDGSDGRPVMAGRHPLGDLAPRDVVSAAVHEVGGGGPVWLDARGLGRSRLEAEFPTVTAACRAHGIDPAADPIPVAPGAHYACGGIRADVFGRTSLPGVYAVGEVAGTGAHGANRLASNSLTEAMITGRRVGELLGAELPPEIRVSSAGSGLAGVAPSARAGMAAAMARDAGVVRDAEGLTRLLDTLDRVPGSSRLDLATVEATNLHTVSALVAAAALGRAESRGCHRRRDAAGADPDLAGKHTVMRLGGENELARIG